MDTLEIKPNIIRDKPSNWNPQKIISDPQLNQEPKFKKKVVLKKQRRLNKHNQKSHKTIYKCVIIKKAFFLLINKGKTQIKIQHTKGRNKKKNNKKQDAGTWLIFILY